ncbi:MAG: hypothetical protein FJ248_06725 [Nitrospira sp.]|nr:hypothetical protein [Nitrospira sp.]
MDGRSLHDTRGFPDWSSLALAGLLLLAGCAEGVKFVQETETGGIVVYPYKGDSALLSSFRGDALKMIRDKCPKGYNVLKEGETKGLRRIQDNVGGSEEITLNRWAIKFSCK